MLGYTDYTSKIRRDVQEYFSVGFPVNPLQHRQQAVADLGQESSKWAHKEDYRQRHSEPRARNSRH